MPKKRAMATEVAAEKKRRGHARERSYADLIGGELQPGDPRQKPDVLDRHKHSHSVKGGKWWQIFLYSRNRWENNTRFQEIGEVSVIMIECLDVFPARRAEYVRDKGKYKERLAEPMKKLLKELSNKEILKDFLTKAIFDEEVTYLAIEAQKDRAFHLFERNDVVKTLCRNLTLVNSRALNKTQYDYQKVIFKCHNNRGKLVNFGEIELRNDSEIHYREMKCRFNGELALDLFVNQIKIKQQKKAKLIAYGKAVADFKL